MDSDDAVRQAILRALAAHPQLGGLHVRVGVAHGVAHLAGEAPSEMLWHLAEAVAADVPGVRGVVNRIRAPGAPVPSRTVDLSLNEEGG